MTDTLAKLTDTTPLSPEVRALASGAKSDNTKHAYKKNWNRFVAWCGANSMRSLPAAPNVVAEYLRSMMLDGLKAASMQLALVAIRHAHALSGLPSPTVDTLVKETFSGIKRKIGKRQTRKTPLVVELLRPAVDAIPTDTLVGKRDAALLLLGFAGALRRSELTELLVEDVVFLPQGLELTLRRSKTDQEGAGSTKAIPYAQGAACCPVLHLRDWLQAAGISTGPLFRRVDQWGHVGVARMDGKSVARIVKHWVNASGLNEADFSGHSMRAGFVTSAHEAGKLEADSMAHTGHKSTREYRKYIRPIDRWKRNPVTGLL